MPVLPDPAKGPSRAGAGSAPLLRQAGLVGDPTPEAVLDAFLAFTSEAGIELYPHQEEALLEIAAGHHVVLGTPTGSGKSLVAAGMIFRAFCEGERAFYTCPTKALVSEKFFDLCELFGAEQVGMLTGDASINRDAPVICCTAEILAQMALREGPRLGVAYAVLDEFHYYADPDRGAAWQIPLLCLPRTRFLLMSATLGNPARIAERLEERTGRPVVCVFSEDRPVPLHFEYRETPLRETVEDLLAAGRAPIYIVHFTQREAAEQAQGLTSARIVSREERQVLRRALDGVRFDSPYGADVRRFVTSGIGIHHAGLLPRYRLLVEQLAQQGLLRVICGTDTLGVGVNVPIRTVVFSRFCKFDGRKVSLLSVREFKQIAGRAGRKGFDEEGFVVCQAPEHVTFNKRARERAGQGGGRARPARRSAPGRGFVPWNRQIFEQHVARPPEPLASRFDLTHGMVVSLLQRESPGSAPGSGYRAVLELIAACHEEEGRRRRLRRRAAGLVRSLRRAGLAERYRDPASGRPGLRVRSGLEREFSLHHALSLYLVETLRELDPAAPDYALDVISLVEAILEDPRPVLQAKLARARRELLARLKAEGVPYEERIARLDEVELERPLEDLVDATFPRFVEHHPWLSRAHIRPKSVAREIFEDYWSFPGYVRHYAIARYEGVLLRYLSRVGATLWRGLPPEARTEELDEARAFFRGLVARVDSSLLEEWESRRDGGGDAGISERPAAAAGLEPARVRSELLRLVRALAGGDFEEAASCLRPDGPLEWDAEALRAAVADFETSHAPIRFDPRVRHRDSSTLRPLGPGRFAFQQVLPDALGEDVGCLQGVAELRPDEPPEAPVLVLHRIGV